MGSCDYDTAACTCMLNGDVYATCTNVLPDVNFEGPIVGCYVDTYLGRLP